ncbi:tetratricopeptide repeat protein [Pseudoalteromonas fenneropenaei]|uniref:histidine kinase n=1 Tax=Pseudoalteromonas fenneropenaei TaxID=1737459 RepID=A0ABV7CC30_9GAMM
MLSLFNHQKIAHCRAWFKAFPFLLLVLALPIRLNAMTLAEAEQRYEQAQALRFTDAQQAIELFRDILAETDGDEFIPLRLTSLESLAFILIDRNQYDSAAEYVSKLETLAIAHSNEHYKVMAPLIAGYVYDRQAQYQQAEAEYRKALAIALQTTQFELVGKAYIQISAVLRRQDNYVQALDVARQSVSALDNYQNTKPYVDALTNLGILQSTLGDYSAALNTLTTSYEISEQLKLGIGISDALYEIGVVYQKMGNYHDALKHFSMAHELDQQYGEQVDFANSAMKIANVAYLIDDYSQSAEYAEKAYGLYRAIDNKVGLANSYAIKGLLAAKQGDFLNAIALSEQSLAIAAEFELDSVLVTSQMRRMDIALMAQDYPSAMQFGEAALAGANRLGDQEDQAKILAKLAGAYQAEQQYQPAYEAYVKATEIRDNLGVRQQNMTLAALQSKAEFMRKQTEIDKLNLDKALKEAKLRENEWQLKAWWFGSAAAILLVALFVYRLRQKRKIAAERAQLLQDVVDRKNRLLADVSHEIRTPLTALYLQIEALQHNISQDVDASYEVINRKLADINRLITDIHQLALADTASLVLNLHDYNFSEVIKLWEREYQQFAHNKGYEWQAKIELPEQVTVIWDIDRIKQVLTNLVANSTFYTDLPGTIALYVGLEHDNVIITLDDSAPGVKDEQLEEIFERLFRVEASRSRQTGGSGLGLAICKSLIAAHQGSITAHHSSLGGLQMRISLPLAAKRLLS